MAKAKPYPLTVDTRVELALEAMVDDLVSGEIDAGMLWGPFAGYYAKQRQPAHCVVPLLKEHADAPMDFPDRAWACATATRNGSASSTG